MEKGDRVYVNWPTGKGGPYNRETYDYQDSFVYIGRDRVTVPTDWCEPAEPELEDNRLYYCYDSDIPDYYKYRSAEKGSMITGDWEIIEPVHRRWDELDMGDKAVFTDKMFKKCLTGEDKYRIAYKVITGEEHP